ncbi:uncharacterized protein [Ptychodera flava]|uniref:uncharacterized protein isoform X2 n=1 Tax=Ptychodera flava TaxID=63121 RepID=UPI00396A94DB
MGWMKRFQHSDVGKYCIQVPGLPVYMHFCGEVLHTDIYLQCMCDEWNMNALKGNAVIRRSSQIVLGILDKMTEMTDEDEEDDEDDVGWMSWREMKMLERRNSEQRMEMIRNHAVRRAERAQVRNEIRSKHRLSVDSDDIVLARSLETMQRTQRSYSVASITTLWSTLSEFIRSKSFQHRCSIP